MSTYHHNNLKNDLLEYGLKMISEEGVEKLSLRKLARICGVSEAAPYSHFKSKGHLLDEMKVYVADKLYNILYEAFINSSKPDCILEIGKAYVEFAMKQPDYFNFLFNQADINIDLSMKNDGDFKPFIFFRDKSYEVYRELGYDDDSIKFGIVSMWTQVHGIAMIASMKNVAADFDWLDVLERILVEKN